MKMPPSRRRSLVLIGSVLLAANVLGVFFALRSAIGEAESAGQYAATASAAPVGAAGADIQRPCNPGEVHTVKGNPPQDETSSCYVRSTQGMVAGPDAARHRACQLSSPQKCVVQYCPPQDALKSGKEGTCFVVSCSGSSNCLGQTMSTLQSRGPLGVIKDTLLADPRTAALPVGTGPINGNEFLTQALNPTVATDLRANPPVGSAIDRINEIAGAIEKGGAPCTACTPTVQLNKELVDAQVRLGPNPDERGTIRIPGGKGFPPPPLTSPQPPSNTGFKFPNIHKDPSGTDVLAWMRHLLGGNPSQPSQCTDMPRPSDAQCTGGSWMSEQSGGCTEWKCVRPRIVSFSAIPQEVNSGERATLGWITEGMKECVVSSPTLAQFTEENKNYTNVNGAVKTPVLTATATFELSCTQTTGAVFPKKALTIGVLP